MAKKNLEERLSALEKEVKELRSDMRNSKFKGLKIGDTFELSSLVWHILDITEKGYVCLADRLEQSMNFDNKCNDWSKSGLRNYLNTMLCDKISEVIGSENLVELERNLLSLDGQTEYGICADKVSIISLDEYRKYRRIIPNAGYYWWTLTPDSTKCNGDTTWIRAVCPSGDVGCRNYFDCFGVRPFCIFASAIFESEE